jgi:endonuclease/exonuclease/phosphatase family metal-dependent hydrolase
LAVGCGEKPQSTPSDILRVMTYNIHHANPPSKPNVIDVEAIATIINKESPDVVALPTLAGTNGEPRVLATANITVNGKELTIACTHLDAQRSDTNRVLQINAIMEILKNEKNAVILAGDPSSDRLPVIATLRIN